MNKHTRMIDRIERAEEIQRYTENRCETLEKENAKLIKTTETFQTSAYKLSVLITKAKELLKRCYENYIYLEPLKSEIEQFLTETTTEEVIENVRKDISNAYSVPYNLLWGQKQKPSEQQKPQGDWVVRTEEPL